MRIRGLVAGLVVALAATALPAMALAPQTPPTVAWRTATAVSGDLGPAIGAPPAWGLHAVQRQLGARDLRVESIRTSLIGTHVRGRQWRGSLPIQGTDWLATAVGGRVVQVEAHPTALPGGPSASPVGDAVARTAAVRQLASTDQVVPPAVRRALVPRAGRLVDTYRVSVVSRVPARLAVVDVDAATGRVLAVGHGAQALDGSALVFDPNPVVSKRDPGLRQPMESRLPTDPDLDSAELTAQRQRLALRDLDPGAAALGRLAGPHVNILGSGYVTGTTGVDFDLTRGDPRFEGLLAYAHLDRYQRYLQGLGFRGGAAVNAEPQDVLPGGVQGLDNSYYDASTDLLIFGSGGVDDAEDAEIVLHEYGHAVQDAQVPGFGFGGDTGAMGEGFGDFQAAAFFARQSGGFGDTCFGDWDATSYAKGSPLCLRRLDRDKVYPGDLTGEVHDDGEIWSAFLWQLRAGLPGDAAQRSDAGLRLVIASHELLTPEATFGHGVAALRTTARALGHPEWLRVIDRMARQRGLPLNP